MNADADTQAVARHMTYGSERIDFLLSRRARKTLAITVHPDLRVEVVAPMDADETAILNRVRARARWILRQRRQFLSWMPKPIPRRYRSGETHRYLGRQYRLRIVKSETTGVSLRTGFIEIHQQETQDVATARKLLDQWFRQQAERRFRRELDKASKRLAVYHLPAPTLRLLRMPKRWGSCTAKGEILLNPELIKTPGACVEYVILHELCHLKHPNHSAAFFRMLDAVLPDWRERKQRLEQAEI
ncbi:MAG: M48 family metallopeptidase [Akkermansiaceae bacterium]|nr:M48 family metallopeptidase [Akkermansiaceae bacterium]